MAENSILNNLFNNPQGLQVENTNVNAPTVEFRPKYTKGQNEEYTATIRFIPNPRDFKKSIISKFVVYLHDVGNKTSGRYIDDPTTVGEKSAISDTFFMFKNSPDVRIQNLSEAFSRTPQHYALIQVLNCPAEPQLVGKILIWKFGIKVKKKIDTEMNSTIPGQAPHHPFDLFMNRPFFVKVTKQNGGQGNRAYNNFDECQFFDAAYPANCMLMEVGKDAVGNPQYAQVTRENCTTEAQQQMVLKYLEDHCPKLEDYEYKPWDADTTNYVNQKIAEYTAVATGQAVGAPQQYAQASAMVGNQALPMGGTAIPMGGIPQGVPGVPQTQPMMGQPGIPQGAPQMAPQAPMGAPQGSLTNVLGAQGAVAPQTPQPGIIPGASPLPEQASPFGAVAPQAQPQVQQPMAQPGIIPGAPIQPGIPQGAPQMAPQAPMGAPQGLQMGIEGNQIPGAQPMGAQPGGATFQGVDPNSIQNIMAGGSAPIPTGGAGGAAPSLDDVLEGAIY